MSVCLGLGFAWSPLLIPQWYIYAWGENCQKSKKRVPTFWQLLALFVLTPKKEEIFFPSWNKISSNKASFFKLQEKPFLKKRPKICKKATQKRRSGTNFRVVMDWIQTPKCGFGLGFWSIIKKKCFCLIQDQSQGLLNMLTTTQYTYEALILKYKVWEFAFDPTLYTILESTVERRSFQRR